MPTCNASGCNNSAHYHDGHWTFYCMNHMRCGKKLDGQPPCIGCLNNDRNVSIDDGYQKMGMFFEETNIMQKDVTEKKTDTESATDNAQMIKIDI
jgi:hypothetical protein